MMYRKKQYICILEKSNEQNMEQNMNSNMKWYVLSFKGTDDREQVARACGHTCFSLESCMELWHTNHFICEEFQVRGYTKCALVWCDEDEMMRLTQDDGLFRRRRADGMGPYDCISLLPSQFDQLILLLHVTDKYQVLRNVKMMEGENLAPAPEPQTAEDTSEETDPRVSRKEVMRGVLRGLLGRVVNDRANLRKFTPLETLPGLRLMLLMPAAELRPLTHVEFEREKLKLDTSAKWYLVLAKNKQHLLHAFRLNVRMRTQEGIQTDEMNLREYVSTMEPPTGISGVRYFYHMGKPFPLHYFFVYTTLADVRSCRVRNPYARVAVVWSRAYTPVSLSDKEFVQLVNSVEGKQQELTEHMQRFLEGLKTGDKLGFFLTNLEETPYQATFLKRKGKKVKVIDAEGRQLTIPQDAVVPLKE